MNCVEALRNQSRDEGGAVVVELVRAILAPRGAARGSEDGRERPLAWTIRSFCALLALCCVVRLVWACVPYLPQFARIEANISSI